MSSPPALPGPAASGRNGKSGTVPAGRRLATVGIPVGIVSIVVMLVVPLPAVMLDVLIASNIAVSLLILLVAMQVQRPLDFAVFPSLILVATLFRLSLNVSSTRLVLDDGYAGKVIDAFGHFVISGNLVIGLVIFLILVVIQFLVITNGAGRVAEVGARFTLDAMPGKQMAIDADLNAGLIDEDTARKRREEVAAEADFYGAMDGASKFVKGDAIAGIIIILINLLGGFAIGVMQNGMTMSEAISKYSLLTIGDGLVTQIPALLLSVATGLIVTRSTTRGGMGDDIVAQFGAQKHSMRLGGGFVLALCVIPGLPKLPFVLVGGALLIAAQRVPDAMDPRPEPEEAAPPVNPDSPEQLAEAMRIDPIELELAADLLDLVDAGVGGDLLERVRALRRKVAIEFGLVLPRVRTRDNLDLPMSTYAVKLNGVEVARGEAPPGCVLAIGDGLSGLPGRATTEPVFGLPATWVPMEMRAHAEVAGATVVDRASVLTTHLAEVVREHASELLGREDVRALLDLTKRTHPSVVEELTPALMSVGEVQRVLQALLAEQVPIRDLVRIFEALSLRAKVSPDLDGLVAAVRTVLGPAICATHLVDGRLPVLTFDPLLEQSLLETVRQSEAGWYLMLDGARVEAIVSDAVRATEAAERTGRTPVLVCSPQLRAAVRRLISPTLPRLAVLSYNEVPAGLTIDALGVVTGAAVAVGG
ncbi:flagellar biosynthesis protein FlhA [Sporichthya brevicatena]|uniref:Flagellar biosynthesis protein FlhA n=2 Tax=Sporichthya brevicatena TaxID=171442 RepID=A0ABP3RFA5_9ACTN